MLVLLLIYIIKLEILFEKVEIEIRNLVNFSEKNFTEFAGWIKVR